MPYERRGALKISDHHVRSPLLNVDQGCQTCHKVSEDELRERVYTLQDRSFETRNFAIDALLDRAVQFYADFVEAENSMVFHADQEGVRILGHSINFSRLGQGALRGEPVPKAPLDAVRAHPKP